MPHTIEHASKLTMIQESDIIFLTSLWLPGESQYATTSTSIKKKEEKKEKMQGEKKVWSNFHSKLSTTVY